MLAVQMCVIKALFWTELYRLVISSFSSRLIAMYDILLKHFGKVTHAVPYK